MDCIQFNYYLASALCGAFVLRLYTGRDFAPPFMKNLEIFK